MRGDYESDTLSARSWESDRELAFNARFASCYLVNERHEAITLRGPITNLWRIVKSARKTCFPNDVTTNKISSYIFLLDNVSVESRERNVAGNSYARINYSTSRVSMIHGTGVQGVLTNVS